ADALSEALGQLPNVRVPLRPPETFSFPNAVLGENRHHSIRIMGVIANVTVFGFQPLDRFNILEDREAFFQFRVIHECNPPSLDNSPIREQKPRLSSRRSYFSVGGRLFIRLKRPLRPGSM